MKTLYKLIVFGLMPAFVYSCKPGTTAYNALQLKPYLKALAKVQHLRDSLGFTAIADTAKITLVGKKQGYDVMLHIDQLNSSRDIAFKQQGKIFEWIGEQETISGPRYIKTTEGDIKESITLSYQKAFYMPIRPGYLTVAYHIPDSTREASNVAHMPDIIPEGEAKLLIKEWTKSN